MTNKAKLRQRALLVLLMAAAAFVGWRYPPPSALVDWAGGQGFWPRAALAVGTYFVFIAVFIPFGVFDALELTLPGLSVKRGQDSPAPDDTTQRASEGLQQVLADVRETNDRAFSDMDALSGQLQGILEKIDDLEGRTAALEAQVSETARRPRQREVDSDDDESAR
jgi:hypothetical protein